MPVAAQRHGKKDCRDLLRASGHRTEPNQAERTCNGDACAKIPVHQHDDHLNGQRQQRNRDAETL